MITRIGVAIAVVQIGLYLARRPTLSHHRATRILVATWCAVLLGHLGYEEYLAQLAAIGAAAAAAFGEGA